MSQAPSEISHVLLPCTLEQCQIDRLDAIARGRHIQRSEVIREAVAQYLEKRGEL